MHCPLRKRGERASGVVFLYRQIKEVKNTFVRIVILGSRNSNMTERGICLLIEDSLFMSTKRSLHPSSTGNRRHKDIYQRSGHYPSARKLICCNRVVAYHRRVSVVLYTAAVTFINSNSNETILKLRH